ncbi:uncharacterized protein DDB_G0287625-like [Octopus sinensis]|uniref:Uncharacterized protein DDB_G0287625-like n=1 Tax=Octopus sinensis TaxID=2607531 RepID=A0A7E6EI72_9MOLL|nr:uncharacterized protein DDB_G0287625-like [Octopus sinensis]
MLNCGFDKNLSSWNFVKHFLTLDNIILTPFEEKNSRAAVLFAKTIQNISKPKIGHIFLDSPPEILYPNSENFMGINIDLEKHKFLDIIQNLQIPMEYINELNAPSVLYKRIGVGNLYLHSLGKNNDRNNVIKPIIRTSSAKVGDISKNLKSAKENTKRSILLRWVPFKTELKMVSILIATNLSESDIISYLSSIKHQNIIFSTTITLTDVSRSQKVDASRKQTTTLSKPNLSNTKQTREKPKLSISRPTIAGKTIQKNDNSAKINPSNISNVKRPTWSKKSVPTTAVKDLGTTRIRLLNKNELLDQNSHKKIVTNCNNNCKNTKKKLQENVNGLTTKELSKKSLDESIYGMIFLDKAEVLDSNGAVTCEINTGGQFRGETNSLNGNDLSDAAVTCINSENKSNPELETLIPSDVDSTNQNKIDVNKDHEEIQIPTLQDSDNNFIENIKHDLIEPQKTKNFGTTDEYIENIKHINNKSELDQNLNNDQSKPEKSSEIETVISENSSQETLPQNTSNNFVSKMKDYFEKSTNLKQEKISSDEKCYLPTIITENPNLNKNKPEDVINSDSIVIEKKLNNNEEKGGLSFVSPINKNPKYNSISDPPNNKNLISKKSLRNEYKKDGIYYYLTVVFIPLRNSKGENLISKRFFYVIRARYYIFSSANGDEVPVLDNLLSARRDWGEDAKDVEVTIIPTYDIKNLHDWIFTNQDTLKYLKINIDPACQRCRVMIGDSEDFCTAGKIVIS